MPVRSLVVEDQLFAVRSIVIGECKTRKQLMNRHLLKYVNTENREDRVYTHFECEFFADDDQQGVDCDRTPELAARRFCETGYVPR